MRDVSRRLLVSELPRCQLEPRIATDCTDHADSFRVFASGPLLASGAHGNSTRGVRKVAVSFLLGGNPRPVRHLIGGLSTDRTGGGMLGLTESRTPIRCEGQKSHPHPPCGTKVSPTSVVRAEVSPGGDENQPDNQKSAFRVISDRSHSCPRPVPDEGRPSHPGPSAWRNSPGVEWRSEDRLENGNFHQPRFHPQSDLTRAKGPS